MSCHRKTSSITLFCHKFVIKPENGDEKRI